MARGQYRNRSPMRRGHAEFQNRLRLVSRRVGKRWRDTLFQLFCYAVLLCGCRTTSSLVNSETMAPMRILRGLVAFATVVWRLELPTMGVTRSCQYLSRPPIRLSHAESRTRERGSNRLAGISRAGIPLRCACFAGLWCGDRMSSSSLALRPTVVPRVLRSQGIVAAAWLATTFARVGSAGPQAPIAAVLILTMAWRETR